MSELSLPLCLCCGKRGLVPNWADSDWSPAKRLEWAGLIMLFGRVWGEPPPVGVEFNPWEHYPAECALECLVRCETRAAALERWWDWCDEYADQYEGAVGTGDLLGLNGEPHRLPAPLKDPVPCPLCFGAKTVDCDLGSGMAELREGEEYFGDMLGSMPCERCGGRGSVERSSGEEPPEEAG